MNKSKQDFEIRNHIVIRKITFTEELNSMRLFKALIKAIRKEMLIGKILRTGEKEIEIRFQLQNQLSKLS